MIRVFSLPPLWGTPTASPFGVKLLTWLQMAELEWEMPPMTSPPASKTGKIPYVVLEDGTMLHDSGLIIEELGRRHGVDLDEGLSARDRARGHALRRMVEEHLYFVGLWERWISEPGWEATARDYFLHLPAPAAWILPRMIRPRMRKYLHGQGLGRHAPEQMLRFAFQDLDALAALLDREFVLGADPRTVDATVYGFLSAFLAHPFESTLGDAVRARPQLVAYVERMADRYWSGA